MYNVMNGSFLNVKHKVAKKIIEQCWTNYWASWISQYNFLKLTTDNINLVTPLSVFQVQSLFNHAIIAELHFGEGNYVRDHLFSTYEKFSVKLLFLTP